MNYAGLLLAGGSGKRMGLPKALVRLGNGHSLVTNGLRILRDGGCEDIILVLGAGDEAVRKSLAAARPQVAEIMGDGRLFMVSNPDYEEGISTSVRVGLLGMEQLESEPDGAIVQLVDTPDISPDAIDKVAREVAPSALAMATYDGTPGHPILIGREHWRPIATSITGDEGARQYLKDRTDVVLVACDGLGSPVDLDTPEQLAARELVNRVPASIVRAEMTKGEISVSFLEILVRDRRAGAVVSFSGTVRDHDEGRGVKALDYLTHPTADEVIAEIAAEFAKVPGVRALAVQHRFGALKIGDVALGCVVAAEHRKTAFDVCGQLVDRVKAEMPIWKRQIFDDDTDEWVNAP